MGVDGTWEITVQTPIGAQQSTLELETDGSSLTGTQTGQGATSEIYDGRVSGNDASWRTDIKVPFPMSLEITATIEGDSITGSAKAGSFGSSPFSGKRVS
jgi:hypothetical protein